MLLIHPGQLRSDTRFVKHGHVAKFFAMRGCIGPQFFKMCIVLRQWCNKLIYTLNTLQFFRHQVLELHVVDLVLYTRLAGEYKDLPSYVHPVEVVAGVGLRIAFCAGFTHDRTERLTQCKGAEDEIQRAAEYSLDPD